MAPTIFNEIRQREPEKQREQHCSFGHDYEELDHWRCDGCHRWFDNYVSHGCSGITEDINFTEIRKQRELQFLLDKRNEEIKRAWKKDQYYKSKQLFHFR